MFTYLVKFISQHFPADLAVRYLIVGAWNTFFGTAIYWLFVWVFEGAGRFGYMLGAVASSVVAVSESFVTYKLIVFRTKGHWVSEYVKCWAVYGGASVINLACLPLFVEATRWALPEDCKRLAPYVGGMILTGVTIVISFIGHKNITFRKSEVRDRD